MPSRRFATPGSRAPYGPHSPQTRWDRGGGPRWDHHRRDHFRRPFFFASSTYLWPYWPYWLGYPEFNGYNNGYYNNGYYNGDPNASTPVASQNAQYDSEDKDNAPTQSNGPAYQTPYVPPAPEPELTVIFKDGHSLKIRNYALTASTLIVLDRVSSEHQNLIPLDEVDVSATQRTARDAGLDFTPPSGS
ncbi:hypothetical protein [Edaphobacter bradus]|uniref:hypothetical protein n=1 Tax=Edaphobacter bradus TaxID=2259016 RepID=UPI0021E017A4|nr:hypothetical protein [Edaphobacter bradus]